MNPLNNATLEASKRLHDAGIVLETEFHHVHNKLKNTWTIRPLILNMTENPQWWEWYPTPSMAEVWRELPEGVWIEIHKDFTQANYPTEPYTNKIFCNTNPTDALIDLLIWVRSQKP